ncbi:maleylpyruvate isomerase family mycothiol-dependent enzyme [Nocardia sp. NPDC058519]|uniref:maleylpyruvate isomerase family mycothiol-dependent enzyme n=1 Tax=Nocardia sp. NPDC058519 TaxID=3346535 RepID=UPI00365F0A2C
MPDQPAGSARPGRGYSRDALWAMAHAERGALADDLADLDAEQWGRPSLCGSWTVEDALAHLTAVASVGRVRWVTSVLAARFDFDEHNERRKAEHRGSTPAETLRQFRAIIPSTTSAPGPTVAWLGEVVVHAQDIRRPLGLTYTPSIEATTAVAEFFAGRDFTVPSRTLIQGVRLEATDGPFTTGTGPLVSGTTIALTMAMAGRAAYCDDLTGPGAPTLRTRVVAHDRGDAR